MKMMERLPTLLVAVLCLGILAVCDIKEAEANNDSVANAILGTWTNGSTSLDYKFDRITRRSYGSGSTDKWYTFHENGTFENAIVSTGYGPGTKAGWLIIKGKYKISGNQIILFNASGSWTDTNYPSNSYKDEPTRDETLRFELVRDNNTGKTILKIQNSSGSYYNFWKQKDNKNQSDQPSYVKARHQYQRTIPTSTSIDEFIKFMRSESSFNVHNETALRAELNSAMEALIAKAKKLNRHENVSYSIVFTLGAAYFILYGEEFDEAKLEAVAKAFDQQLGRRPQLDNETNDDRQRKVDQNLLLAVTMLGIYQNAVKSQNAEGIKFAKNVMQQRAQKFVGDTKDLKSRLEELALHGKQ